jgi:hypothetical protein
MWDNDPAARTAGFAFGAKKKAGRCARPFCILEIERQ